MPLELRRRPILLRRLFPGREQEERHRIVG